ncbi:ketopantoate reductase family protein [Dendrosporobacter sp. 1207_IL3150]|uniref:ketopantoate reductase family protein n=1 Tax=Dendrosporobacter sp. 1207_IL3150 TaxID=3084054 RepID=UPI002FDA9DC8
MKIAIIGAGAMGSLFGAMLAQGGQDVILIDKRTELVQAITQNGLKIIDESSEIIVNIRASADITDAEKADLIILFVKAYDTQQAIQDCIRIIDDKTVVLTMQNGLGNIEKIGTVIGEEKVIAGSTSYGCIVAAPGLIKVSNIGKVTLGELNGSLSGRLLRIAETFSSVGINVSLSENIQSLIWTKLAVNTGINAITAITSLTNGELLVRKETRELMNLAINELVSVANHKGIRFLQDPFKLAEAVAKDTYTNKSSMLQDIEKGSKTEIDNINGAIVAEGKKYEVETPVNHVLTLLIKALEKQ